MPDGVLIMVGDVIRQQSDEFIGRVSRHDLSFQFVVFRAEADLFVRVLWNSILGEWRPAGVAACVLEEVFLRHPRLDVDVPPTLILSCQ